MKPLLIIIAISGAVVGSFFFGFVEGQKDVRMSTVVRISEPHDPIYRGIFFGECFDFRTLSDQVVGQACATEMKKP